MLRRGECAPVAAPAEVSPLSIAERVYATNVPQARLLNAETVQKRPRGDPFDWPPHHPILTDQTRGLLHRCGNTIGGPRWGRQSCRFCSPSGQPIGRCRAPADRGPSSNPPRFFCHWQRFGGFLESGLLAPPQAALRRFPPSKPPLKTTRPGGCGPLFWTSPPGNGRRVLLRLSAAYRPRSGSGKGSKSQFDLNPGYASNAPTCGISAV